MPLSRALVPTVVRLLFGLLLLSGGSPPEAAAAAEGQLTWAVHISLAPDVVRPGRDAGDRSRRTWSSTPCTTRW